MIEYGAYKGDQPASSLRGLVFTPVWLLGPEGPEGGGSSGIRTHGPCEQAAVLKTAAIDRSAMLPVSLVSGPGANRKQALALDKAQVQRFAA